MKRSNRRPPRESLVECNVRSCGKELFHLRFVCDDEKKGIALLTTAANQWTGTYGKPLYGPITPVLKPAPGPRFFDEVRTSTVLENRKPSVALEPVVAPPKCALYANLEKRSKLSREEKDYLVNAKSDIVKSIVEADERITQQEENVEVPIRFRVLRSHIPDASKLKIIKKLDKANENLTATDTSKFTTWVESLLTLPLSAYCTPLATSETDTVSDRLAKCLKCMDKAVFGHAEAKRVLIESVLQWHNSPLLRPRAIGLEGTPGNGKTTLVREGIARMVDRPFSFVSLGGSTDASYLFGHLYCYEGSQPGKVAESLQAAKCMNPIIYFDELDKISETPRGDEVINCLIHLTDPSQSDQFRDRYFQGISLDLSRSLLVFSFNDSRKISKVLLDRLQVVKTDAFGQNERLDIAKKHLVGSALRDTGLDDTDSYFSDEALEFLCDDTQNGPRGGVRLLQKRIERIVRRFAVYRETNNLDLIKPFTQSCFLTACDGKTIFTLDSARAALDSIGCDNDSDSIKRLYM